MLPSGYRKPYEYIEDNDQGDHHNKAVNDIEDKQSIARKASIHMITSNNNQ